VAEQNSAPGSLTDLTVTASTTLQTSTLPLQGSHLIEASAGTGKTYNIVRIYLRLLLEKRVSVEQILLMTFTVAATAELRSRLDRFLREALQNWDATNDKFIQQLKNRAVIADSKAKLLLRKAILQLDEAAIYTIHGFCKRALAQQAFFSGMSFRAELATDQVLLAMQATRDWYRNIQSRDDYQVIANRWPNPEVFYQHWQPKINSLQPLLKPASIDLVPITNGFRESWPLERESFIKLNKVTARTAAESQLAIEGLLEKLDGLVADSDELPNFTRAELKKCFSTQKKIHQMPVAFELVTKALAQSEITQSHYVIDGLEFIRQRLSTSKEQLEQMDFGDLIYRLRDTLKGPNGAAVAAALHKQFPVALVDEFQDTDPHQYEILRTIYASVDDVSQYMLCMIGDPKQAIYAFRGGDVFAYLNARRNAQYTWSMNTNYRSSAPVVNGYNQLFLQGAHDRNSEVFGFGINYQRVNTDAANPVPVFSDDRSPVQWVEILSNSEEQNRKGLTEPFKARIADWLALEIVSLLSDTTRDGEPILPADIAVIVRTGKEAALIQDALVNAGLASVYLSSRESIFQTREAHDLLLLLQGIWQHEDDRRFTAALASLWIGMDHQQLGSVVNDQAAWSEWQEKFGKWRDNWQSIGLMSVLLECLKNTGQFYQYLNQDRVLTNCLHLAERLQIVSNQHRSPDALLHWYEQILQDTSTADENLLRLESEEALIKILTMHGAKGLEFPIVFLPFISYQSQPKTRPMAISYHDRQGFDLRTVFLPDPEQHNLQQQEDKAERVRLLYVAATRAAQRLYCCIAPFKQFAGSAVAETLKRHEYDRQSLIKKVCLEPDASLITVNEAELSPRIWSAPAVADQISPAIFSGSIERDWRLTSFSALTRHINHSHRSYKDRDTNVENDAGEFVSEAIKPDLLLRFAMAKGAETGNLVHDLLEHCDFFEPDFSSLWQRVNQRHSSLTQGIKQADLQQWLTEILATPLANTSLKELDYQSTLREAEYYFPMNGDDISQLADFIAARRGSPYQLPERYSLKGMMHGFIDLVFESAGKYYVVDYKSTHLGNDFDHYSQQALQLNIQQSSYDLQYTLYSLALHRYLKTRLPDYQADEHYGGIYYLYLRGMHPDHQSGVFFDRLSSAELEELDRLFAGSGYQGSKVDRDQQAAGSAESNYE